MAIPKKGICMLNKALATLFLGMALTGGNLMAANKTATIGGGCFWCLEAVFEELKGVKKVVSGYAGGHVENPSYQAVCAGETGHAEVVQISYDDSETSYEEILDVFFSIHDPTTLNRQGNDVGTQYRSIILYHDAEQKKTAQNIISKLEQEALFVNPVVTEVVPMGVFFAAENYHQDYFKNNPNQMYCQLVVSPKVKKFKEKYPQRAK